LLKELSHMHDYELHVRAIVEDLNYWRAKRLEASVFRFARLGAVTLYDVMESYSAEIDRNESQEPKQDLEVRIRALEIRLGDYIKGVMVIETVPVGDVVIDDLRKEGGSYDKFFVIAKKYYTGPIEQQIEHIGKDLGEYQSFLNAFTQALVQRRFISKKDLLERQEQIKKSNPENGARIVARAWVDSGFKQKLLSNAREAVRDFGTPLSGTPNLRVVENTDSVHNVIVCTLCSCYPYDLLGNPPWWYKHDDYKTTIVKDPRNALATMFNFKVPDQKEIQVHDSTSDYRYFVLPQRPDSTEDLSEVQLAKLVTPESLIGTAEPLKPNERQSAEILQQ
jgi:nitrile hydratase subunit alpha